MYIYIYIIVDMFTPRTFDVYDFRRLLKEQILVASCQIRRFDSKVLVGSLSSFSTSVF